MECKSHNLLECCLFFTVNSLARVITRMGEEEFAGVGMAPSYAFILTLVVEKPGISQKDLAACLHMAPSTVSRFIDTLEKRALVKKDIQGRNTFIHPTEKGVAMKPVISAAWLSLYERYIRILGREEGELLTRSIADAYRKLEEE